MAKKKQLAGKETKLAKLPLTRALTGQEPEPTWQPASPAAAPLPASAPPAERPAVAAQSGLAATYLYLLQELTDLKTQLHPALTPPDPAEDSPWQALDPLLMELALWRARQSLRDLQSLLSRS